MLLFRQSSYGEYPEAPPEKMQQLGAKWQQWSAGIAAGGKLSSNGIRLSLEGKVLKPRGVITDGPFVETKEILGSFIIVKANTLDEAIALAHGCPALDEGGSVEVRPVYS